MKEFMLKPARRVDCGLLRQRLSERHVPFREATKGNLRIIRLGPHDEFDVATATGRGERVSKASITVRYDHPVLKIVLIDWLEECCVSLHEDFFKAQFGLPPAVLESIKTKWRLDLSGLPVTPLRLCKYYSSFYFGENVAANIAAQLAGVPHKRLEEGEFIKCPDCSVIGEKDWEVEVYFLRSQNVSRFVVIEWDAPVVSIVSLWEIPKDAPADIKINEP